MRRPLRARVAAGVAGLATVASAHLAPAQRGTLTLTDAGAFLVLSLPVSAFPQADDDGDGRLSPAELARHHDRMSAAIRDRVQWLDDEGPRLLEDLLLSPSGTPGDGGEAGAQLVVTGRFSPGAFLAGARLRVALFGATEEARHEHVVVARGDERQLLVFSPARTELRLFPSPAERLAAALRQGAGHILRGLDHLLFLLVVLAAGGGWRHLLLTLTCFTAGHAVTLALTAWGGVAVPAAVVEPAIAATIVVMALRDGVDEARGRRTAGGLRLGLVLGCALVHGLGLATAMEDVGLDAHGRATFVVGFNLGVELAQVAVAAAALALSLGAAKVLGPRVLPRLRLVARAVAVLAGSFWFVARLVG